MEKLIQMNEVLCQALKTEQASQATVELAKLLSHSCDLLIACSSGETTLDLDILIKFSDRLNKAMCPTMNKDCLGLLLDLNSKLIEFIGEFAGNVAVDEDLSVVLTLKKIVGHLLLKTTNMDEMGKLLDANMKVSGVKLENRMDQLLGIIESFLGISKSSKNIALIRAIKLVADLLNSYVEDVNKTTLVAGNTIADEVKNPADAGTDSTTVAEHVQSPSITVGTKTSLSVITVKSRPANDLTESSPATTVNEKPLFTSAMKAPPVSAAIETAPVTCAIKTPPVSAAIETLPVTCAIKAPPDSPDMETVPVTCAIKARQVTEVTTAPPLPATTKALSVTLPVTDDINTQSVTDKLAPGPLKTVPAVNPAEVKPVHDDTHSLPRDPGPPRRTVAPQSDEEDVSLMATKAILEAEQEQRKQESSPSSSKATGGGHPVQKKWSGSPNESYRPKKRTARPKFPPANRS